MDNSTSFPEYMAATLTVWGSDGNNFNCPVYGNNARAIAILDTIFCAECIKDLLLKKLKPIGHI